MVCALWTWKRDRSCEGGALLVCKATFLKELMEEQDLYSSWKDQMKLEKGSQSPREGKAMNALYYTNKEGCKRDQRLYLLSLPHTPPL